MTYIALHFIGFKGNEFNSAVKIWGRPDFIHRNWDVRAKFGGEIHPNDILVFAKGTEYDEPNPYSYDDSAVRDEDS